MARALCDEDSLQAEFVFLYDVLRQNSYNNWQTDRLLNCHLNIGQPDITQTRSPSCLMSGSGVLAQYNITSVGLSHKKVSTYFQLVKDNLGLRTLGV
jgi:hypothetical protein